MGKSQDLYKRAKMIIPTGTQLLSKRPEMFLPDLWPAYYKKAQGCEVWDLDDRHYYDFAQMGVGCCTLGYANENINKAVMNAVNNGSMCSLNSYEEVELTERLINIHTWAECARYARSGGEACAIAVRIARAATGKDKVLFCGYHGWTDWYISANITNLDNLNEQLLPGLEPLGVPQSLKSTAIPFLYNDISSFKNVVAENYNDIAAIIMEPMRGEPVEQSFLEEIRAVANKINAVLIFDEVTSGFRLCVGGIHKILGIEPDIAVFGKALGNGYPITAIIGKKEVMEAANKSFISSTFWTERIGFAAGVATLDEMERINSPNLLVKYGDQIVASLKKCAENNHLRLLISHISPLAHIDWDYSNGLEIQTLYAQMMLEKGFLVSSAIYSCTVYSDDILQEFEKNTEIAFEFIANAIEKGNVEKYLKGPVKQSGFARLVK